MPSFEPLLEPFDKFNQIFKNDSQVSVFNCAIGHKNKDTIIHKSKRDDSSSLLPITDNQSKIFPGTEEVGTTNIKMKKIDTFIKEADFQKPALMKIDVQGFDKNVILQALTTAIKDREYFNEEWKQQQLQLWEG